MTHSLRLPKPSTLSILLLVASAALLALAFLHYGTLTGALAFGLALGSHLALLRLQHAPKVWSVSLLAAYVLAFALAILICPPIRVCQSSRRWLPAQTIALGVRSFFDPEPLRSGDLVAYRPAIPNSPLTLGLIVALPHQRLSVQHAQLRIDDTPIPATPSLARLLTAAGSLDVDRFLVPGEFAIIPTNLVADLRSPGDARRLAFDLPSALIVPRVLILGRIWHPRPRLHPARFKASFRPRPFCSTHASSPSQGT